MNDDNETDYHRLTIEEGLSRFQEDQLPEVDQEWHRLVPREARDVLGKNEVKRQSVLFEVFKSERDYVADLELVREVCRCLFSRTTSNNPIIILGVRRWSPKCRSTSC